MKQRRSDLPVSIPGFSFSAVAAGIKKSGRKDLALIFSHSPSVTAGVFTTNSIKAAPVRLAMSRMRSRKACLRGQAIIVNSGNANACTGSQGMKDAMETSRIAAKALGVNTSSVYASSTGVIGEPLPMDKIRKAIPLLAQRLSPASLHDAASAIMTTDSFPKMACRRIRLAGKTATLAGIAKGAGMINPGMATMLCFLLTDLAVTPSALTSALRTAVDRSFNQICVDNDMSTNDSVIILANGMLKNPAVTKSSHLYSKVEAAMIELTGELARMIVSDGEGATKVVEIVVKRARTEEQARRIAKAVAQSLLVKTAMYGEDPNWGRILAAVGYAGVAVQERKIGISMNGVRMVRNGVGTGNNEAVRETMRGSSITVTIDLATGNRTGRALTCDLTEKYIKINALYRT